MNMLNMHSWKIIAITKSLMINLNLINYKKNLETFKNKLKIIKSKKTMSFYQSFNKPKLNCTIILIEI